MSARTAGILWLVALAVVLATIALGEIMCNAAPAMC